MHTNKGQRHQYLKMMLPESVYQLPACDALLVDMLILLLGAIK